MSGSKNKKLFKTESRKRLFGIKLPPISNNENNNINTIIDVDPDFYSLVEGRPIKPNRSIYRYKQDIRNVALKRTLYGFLIDEILRIDRDIEAENGVYETATKHFEECKISFDKFLAHDNNKTIDVMQKSDALAKELTAKLDDHKSVSYEMASIKSKIQYIDETLLILMAFENFLHKTSPILWQEKNSVELNKTHSEIFTIETDIFYKINVEAVNDTLKELTTPRLYFEKPQQLLEIFELLEKQNLNYLLVTEELNSSKNVFLKARNHFKDLMRIELNYIKDKIEETEETIEVNENRENEVKEIFFRILNDKISFLVSSETALQIQNYVEYAFEKILCSNETNLSALDMTYALEREYDNLMVDLSAFDLKSIKLIEKEMYENEAKLLTQAKESSKILKDVNKLTKRLQSSYEPSKRLINH